MSVSATWAAAWTVPIRTSFPRKGRVAPDGRHLNLSRAESSLFRRVPLIRKSLFSRASCAAVAVCLATIAGPALAQQPPLEQPGKWAQNYTGRQADPAVRSGTLPNGLRYAIMHNETPSDGVAMRMRIGSGSLQESDDEQGLAHFIEHMAFRGSTNIADGDVVRMLQRQGLQFGADTNAFTAQDETVYMFNFPKADATALDTGLTLFREIGGRLKLAPAAIDAERGVILSEERLRDTPAYRAIKAELGTALDGTRLIKRWPIGTVEDIKAAGHDQLERYYRANYRPDNATIVVVGNIDPAAVEKQIVARFSDWNAQGAPESIDLGTPTGADKVGEIVAPGFQNKVALDWVGPADRRAETVAVDRDILLRQIALTVLNQRLSDRALEPGSPLVGVQAGEVRSLYDSGSLTTMVVETAPEKWQEALDAVTAEQRMLLRDGIQPAELKRAVASLKTAYENAAATASTRKSPDIADAIVRTANADELYTSPAQDLAFATPILASVTPEQANAALKAAFARQGPILFRSAENAPAGDAKLAQALATAYSRPLGAAEKQATIQWPYDDFGKASAVTSKTVDAKLGTTLVRFGNGTRLLVKPTNYEKDKVAVGVLLGNGRSEVRPDAAHALWQTEVFPLVGTGKLPLSQISQWAQENDKVISVALQAGNRAFVLQGSTRPADLVKQMQLLDAYARDPGFRPEAYEKAKALGPAAAGQIAGNPGSTYSRAVQDLMVGNDPRFERAPSSSDLATVTPQDLPALVKQPLASQADIVMVGDVTVEQSIAATQASFAAGPGGAAVPKATPQVLMAKGRSQPYVAEHTGRADQAFYGEFFQLPDYFAAPKTSAVADVAAAILSSRLVDTVREKLGITYSPQVSAATSVDLPGEAFFGVTLETPPANFDKFHALLADQIADLASKPVSADELERAKQPLIETERKNRETNNFWLGKLTQVMRDPRVEGEVLGTIDRLSAVTAADVQALVAKYLAGHQPVTVIAKAKPR
jgi:zinc protease